MTYTHHHHDDGNWDGSIGTTFTHSMTLTYGTDVRHIIGELKGPNLLGEFFRAVEANYDAETGKTRVLFEQLRLPRVEALREAA